MASNWLSNRDTRVRRGPVTPRATRRTFTGDPGLRGLIQSSPPSPGSEASRPVASRLLRTRAASRPTDTSGHNDDVEDDSEDSLVGAQVTRKKRKRRTKAEITAEKIAPLIRDVVEEPPDLILNSRDIRRLGATGVGEREQGKAAFRLKEHSLPQDFSQTERGSVAFGDLDHTMDKFNRRVNRTDSRTYKKPKPTIGLDVDDDSEEYDEDPVPWPHRDKALKSSIDVEGSQWRADPRTLGHDTPLNFDSESRGPSIPTILSDGEEPLNWGQTSPPRTPMYNIRLDGDDDDDDDDDVDSLFADVEDLGNAISPGDVAKPASDASHTPVQGFAVIPKTSKPLDWDHAVGWAKLLRKQGYDFLRNGDDLDRNRILGTIDLKKPMELEDLDRVEVQVKIEDDDQLFEWLQEDYDRKEKEKEKRQEIRARVLQKHKLAETLFKDLRTCVMMLIGREEEQKRLREQMRSSEMRLLGLGTVRYASTPSIDARRQREPSPQAGTSTRSERHQSRCPPIPTAPRYVDEHNSRRHNYRGPHHLNRDSARYHSRDGSFHRSASHHRSSPRDDPRERVYDRRSNQYRRNLAVSSRRRNGPRPRNDGGDSRYQQDERGLSGGSRPFDQRRSPRGLGSGGESFRPRGGFQIGGPSDPATRPRPRGRFDWGSGRNETTQNQDFRPWNPDADELDPIKKQFGAK